MEKLMEQFEIEYLTDNETGEKIYRSNKLNRYRKAIEEIKDFCLQKCEVLDV